MRYLRLLVMAASALYAAEVQAKPPAYQQCVELHLDQFRKAELDAAKELQRALVALRDFPEVQKTVRKNYEFGLRLRKLNLDLELSVSKALCID
ncbi:hypothetical protein [Microvirga aerophila]|jgi:hypothetical protein|uniref:Uncharacterized protein n=1 Tax=Microvirga aerophila TaxID=670291 RepID=A0A512C1K1_9HYPH|nr:hypothetical protein [Microvirga aerophila]GEO18092.1 hypothetical protein MAE02_57880 [Microvirga aerophila]